jgi:hypothetical protein
MFQDEEWQRALEETEKDWDPDYVQDTSDSDKELEEEEGQVPNRQDFTFNDDMQIGFKVYS